MILFRHSTKVKSDNGRGNYHHIICCNIPPQGKEYKNAHHRQGHDGLHLNQRREILKKVQIAHPLSIYGILPNR